jgi:acetyl-CoA synthetase
MNSAEAFRQARDFLIRHRTDYEIAYRTFAWPRLERFNWALDWFDGVLAIDAATANSPALWIVESGRDEIRISFAEMAARSNKVANFFRTHGITRGDRILLMLDNVVPLWETMLAAMKLGAVVIPASTLLTSNDLARRLERGKVRHVVADAAHAEKFAGLEQARTLGRFVVAGSAAGWLDYAAAHGDAFASTFSPDAPTLADDPLFLYFTSGTTANPKLVPHTHRSYPVGSLSTMYWLGLQPGDVHLNISSPGWAKHAWSCFFAPWNAGATIFIATQPRFNAAHLLEVLAAHDVTTLCAPPTVWRMLIQSDLGKAKTSLREVCSAGEPLNPEVIDHVRKVWGLTPRDGYGQTETTAQIANPPGARLKSGSMGRPLPGYRIVLLDHNGIETNEGEVCLPLGVDRPAGLMQDYESDEGASGMREGYYRTGDVAQRDPDGYFTFIGRADDVFKASDYRISPFELESVLIEHDEVAEAAVVPAPDPIRTAVPKAYIICTVGTLPSRELALSIFRHTRARLAPYQRIRRIEIVGELPKTISGKIRRVDLRNQEIRRAAPEKAGADQSSSGTEYREEDFAELG